MMAEKKKKKKKKKKSKVIRFAETATAQELTADVDKVMKATGKPKVFAKRLGELLTRSAQHPVGACYIPGVETEILRGTLPWVRIMHTDGINTTSASMVAYSDSALLKKKIARKMIVNMCNNLNKNQVKIK